MIKNYFLKKKSAAKSLDLRVVNKRSNFLKAILLMIPAFIILIVFTIIPFINTVKDGFHNIDGSGGVTWDTFNTVFHDPNFTHGMTNSLLYAIISVPLILVISVVISSAISSLIRKKIRGFFQTIFFLPYVTSAIAISLAFTFLFDWDTGIINKIIIACGGKGIPWLTDVDPDSHSALWGMLIYGVWRGLAFNILIFTTAMLGVDKTLYKSASIDGAGPVRQFFTITLPSIKRTMSFLLIMGIIGAIKVFPLALFNNDTRTAFSHNGSTLMLYIYHHANEGNYEIAGASSLLLLIISIVYTIVFRGGINQLIKLASWLGEKRVSNKIKNKSMIK